MQPSGNMASCPLCRLAFAIALSGLLAMTPGAARSQDVDLEALQAEVDNHVGTVNDR